MTMARAICRRLGYTLVSLRHPLVRRALLLGEGPGTVSNGSNSLQELAEIFAVAVGGFSVLDHDLHLLVRLDPDSPRPGPTKKSSGAGENFLPRERNRASRCRSPRIGSK